MKSINPQLSIGGQLTSSSEPLSTDGRWAFKFDPNNQLANIEVQVNTNELIAGSASSILTSKLSMSDIEQLVQWLTGVRHAMKAHS